MRSLVIWIPDRGRRLIRAKQQLEFMDLYGTTLLGQVGQGPIK